MEMKDLIQRIAEALVDRPEQVIVTALAGSQATVLELKVAKEDLGKIIGKHQPKSTNAQSLKLWSSLRLEFFSNELLA